MIEEARNRPRTRGMTSFRPRLKQLMLKRSLEVGKQLTQTEVAEEAGVSLATVQRWYRDGATFDRIDAETFYALLDYFDCRFEDLIERVSDQNLNTTP